MISGRTTLAAVIGSPVRHSLSPVIHNAGFAALGLDWVFAAFEIERGGGGAAVAAMRALGLGGMSVTMPLKSDVIAGLDRLDPTAARLDAVNCIAWDGDELVGYNTDGAGFVDGLADDLGVTPSGRTFGVVGAGGAARAVISALGDAGAASVLVVNRSDERAQIAASMAGPVGRVAVPSELAAVDVIVQATPVGMGDGRLPFDLHLLTGQVVVDLVYEPSETPLLSAARELGLATANGVSMLVHQAAHAFRRWTGEDPPVEQMRRAILSRKL